jgi:Skp family chaperone for outer membrane proteins
MKIKFSEYLIAYLTLLSGLMLSIVAEYYSIAGLASIFAAAVIPVTIMGVALGLGKIVSTVWLKQNWNSAPWTIKIYLSMAIVMLMLITSLGSFGYLSKAHSDQSLVSGDVQSRIAVYDEKIKTARENIENSRKQLKQMDEAVDQIMSRSQDEKGANKANTVRKSQQKDRAGLAKDIEFNQKMIATLNDESAPIRAEVRKVEAEVGPIKYIAAFVYGSTDENVLERAVTWMIILIIFVFDPLALMLLIASQISFREFKNRIIEDEGPLDTPPVVDTQPIEDEEHAVELEHDLERPLAEQHPYLFTGGSFWRMPEGWSESPPQVYRPDVTEGDTQLSPSETALTDVTEFEDVIEPNGDLIESGPDFDAVTADDTKYIVQQPVFRNKVFRKPQNGYVQNEEQMASNLWAKTTGKT